MLDLRSGSILRVWAGRVYEIVCFRQLWLVKPAPTIAQIIQLTMPNAFRPNYQLSILYSMCSAVCSACAVPKSLLTTYKDISIPAAIPPEVMILPLSTNR